MRREYIYPHRSVRSFPISPWRLCAALTLAFAMSVAVFYLGTRLLDAHNRVSWFILKYTGIPASGTRSIEIFPGLGPVDVHEVPPPAEQASPLRNGILFAAALTALIFSHRKFPLGRNFVVFLMILLCASGIVVLFVPSFYFDAVVYSQIWLRGEILVWLLLPWVSALLFVLTIPSVAGGFLWGVLIECYIVFWSALRLAFCLGVLHYTGILFLPLLWFVLGILFDLVIVLFFYSLALERSIKRNIGGRRS
jgi:hypothetical protein